MLLAGGGGGGGGGNDILDTFRERLTSDGTDGGAFLMFGNDIDLGIHGYINYYHNLIIIDEEMPFLFNQHEDYVENDYISKQYDFNTNEV